MRFAHFEFDPETDQLGEGPLSEVYRAVDMDLERTVALKVLRSHAEIDPKAPDSDRVAAGLPTLPDVVRRAQEKNGREPIAEGLEALRMNGLYCAPEAWEATVRPSDPITAALEQLAESR